MLTSHTRVTPNYTESDNVMITFSALTHTESHRLRNVMLTSHTETHGVTPSQKCNDNLPDWLTPSHTESEM